MKVLIVEDDELILIGLKKCLEKWGATVSTAATEDKAIENLKQELDLIITDVKLADNGSGIEVVKAANSIKPTPIMLAISGEATPLEAFLLAKEGVVGYIPKPLEFTTFIATIESILESVPELDSLISAQVGKRTYSDVLFKVRQTMVEQALAKCNGNKVKAAKLLNVTRQAVQQMLKSFEDYRLESIPCN